MQGDPSSTKNALSTRQKILSTFRESRMLIGHATESILAFVEKVWCNWLPGDLSLHWSVENCFFDATPSVNASKYVGTQLP